MQIMKIRTILSVIVIALVSSACDFLETSVDRNSTGETIQTNYSAIWGFGRAFYTPIGYGFGMIDSNIFATASDEAQQTSAQSNVIYFNKGMLNENINPLFTYYRNYYEGIRAANFFLDYVADGKGEEMLAHNRNLVTDKVNYERDLQSLAWFKAEAHVARAYYYSELAKMYGGVPIVESHVDDGTMIPRASYDSLVTYIVKEIDDYKAELAPNWDEFKDREGRFTLGVALAIKARTLLYAASPLHNPENSTAIANTAFTQEPVSSCPPALVTLCRSTSIAVSTAVCVIHKVFFIAKLFSFSFVIILTFSRHGVNLVGRKKHLITKENL